MLPLQLVGDHFVSHTIIIMICAWLIILLIARFVLYKKETIEPLANSEIINS